jgi:pilus assembly protein Flp/PilA
MSKLRNWTISKVAAYRAAQDEEGQGLAEYGLILALIAVVCIGALTLLGSGLAATLGEITDVL